VSQTLRGAFGETDGDAPAPDPDRVLSMFQTMCLIRVFEETAPDAVAEGENPGGCHQSIGQEAVPVGVCTNLEVTDYIFSNHRGHGHAIAKGARLDAMMKELFAREGGTSNGKGGSMHIADFSVGMLGANGIVGDGVPLAVGAAQAMSIKGEDRVVVVFVGDGAMNRGPVLEGLNWSKVFGLPLLFVCEDNRYASSTVTRVMTAGGGPSARAEAFGIPSEVVDGNDLLAVDEAAALLLGRIRRGEGPQFLHALTYRVKGHVARDPLKYRPAGETDEHWRDEPIARTEQWLRDNGVSDDAIAGARAAAEGSIKAAWDAAMIAPRPDPATAFTDVQDLGGPEHA
jgi:TPP-dependent pyruvate/acetoin dehydrogenase alpha subunit